MEEDIKILEEYTEKDIPCDSCRYCGERPNVSKALRNLIARNKELEEENANLRDTNKKLYEMGQRQAMQILIEEEYIPKSKVKEKIEELNDLNSKFSQRVIKSKEFYLTELVQNILQELLEDS